MKEFENPRFLYIYDGPVSHFDVLVVSKWHAETRAVSSRKALRNLEYQYKVLNGLNKNAKVTLDPNYILQGEMEG